MAGKRKPRFSSTIFPGQLAQENLALKNRKKRLENLERANRTMLIDTFFAGAGYGTNSLDMDDGRTATLTQGQTFKVEEAMIDNIREHMKTEFGINVDALFRWKPELNKTVYDSLSEDEQAYFNQCLTITDASPQLAFKEPAKWKSPYPDDREAIEGDTDEA